jgi:uncharacterized protein (TIGR00369 family)
MKHAENLIKFFSKIPFNQLLGLSFHALENDQLILRFAMQSQLIGNFFHGILHGGVISSVLDMVGGGAAIFAYAQKHKDHSIEQLQEELNKTSTINLHIDYLHPGKGTDFFAKGKILRTGNRIIVTQMELRNEADVLIASASGTYLIG